MPKNVSGMHRVGDGEDGTLGRRGSSDSNDSRYLGKHSGGSDRSVAPSRHCEVHTSL